MKNGFPAPNKEPTKNQKLLLDRKSPIQVRILFPPPESPCEIAAGRVERGTRTPKTSIDRCHAVFGHLVDS